MADYLRALAGPDKDIVIALCDATDVVAAAIDLHELDKAAGKAFGNALMAGYLMQAFNKERSAKTTLAVKGSRAAGKIVVHVAEDVLKGYVDVQRGSTADAQGYISVLRELRYAKPFSGQSPLVSEDLAKNIAYYYASSEGQPTVVVLDVLFDDDERLIAAGGLIAQLLPAASETTIALLESKLDIMATLPQMLRQGLDLPAILQQIVNDNMPYRITLTRQFDYRCDCSVDKVSRALISLGVDELKQIRDQDGSAQLNCHYCHRNYDFSASQLTALIKQIQANLGSELITW